MIWMPITNINILYAVLLTSMTGAIFTLLFVLSGKILERMGFLHIRYELLKVAAFFYLCPVAYLFLKLFEMEIGYGKLFNPTPFITLVSSSGMKMWCTGVMLGFCLLFYDLHMLKKRYANGFECRIPVCELFSQLLKELEIAPGKVMLCQSYGAGIPCLVGIRRPRIILPVEDYEEKTLRMILLHELTHYKQKDVLLKRITFLIVIFHFFNPFAWFLFFQVQKQSEYVCDYRAGQRSGNLKQYFGCLVAVSSEDGWFSVLSSQLFERKHELVERVKKMKQVSKIRKKSRISVALLLMLVLLTSNMTVYAATMTGVDAYLKWYEETDEVIWDNAQELPQYEEIISYGENPDVVTVVADAEQLSRSVSAIDWTVNNNVKMCTSYFNCAEGDNVRITVAIEPSDVNISVGIERDDGMKISVYGKEWISHSFTVPYGGNWRVFVQNQSGETITAEGCYIR